MPNPMLQQLQSEKPLTLTRGAKRIFRGIYKSQQSPAASDDEAARIKVSEVISKMAFYYEKIRNSVDYREESLLRKGAVTRILKRLIVIEGSLAVSKEHQDPEKTAASLLIELIRAGYLANNKLPETMIDEVSVILDRYLKLRQLSWEMAVAEGKLFDRSLKNFKDSADAKSELSDWILGMAASEIEEKLSQNAGTDVIVGDMYQTLERNIELPNGAKYAEDLPIQIYLSIYRNY